MAGARSLVAGVAARAQHRRIGNADGSIPRCVGQGRREFRTAMQAGCAAPTPPTPSLASVDQAGRNLPSAIWNARRVGAVTSFGAGRGGSRPVSPGAGFSLAEVVDRRSR